MSGYSITNVEEVPANGAIANLIEGKRGRVLKENSVVDVYLTRGTPDVLVSATLGGIDILSSGPVNTVAAAGSLPSTQDDRVITAIGLPNDELIVTAVNSSGAPIEARVLVKVMPIDDSALVAALNLRGAK